ncbi:MAG: transglycosylase domain-containing protein [Vampirovibrionales bacterium]|nr:transglycosylase domain-containing protein [Vampirovibrionales bacterium]
MSKSPQELPVDIRRKSELVQDRIGVMMIITVMAIITFLLFLLSVILGFIVAKGAASLPDVRTLEEWRPNESTRIFDKNGVLIANIHGDEDRVVVPLSEISPNISRAVMAIEDNRFYEHSGVDVRGTMRAFAQNVKGGDVQGGSTLTQQLVKNLFLTPDRKITRKVAEAILAMRVENHYDKNRILEMYLNQVYWGNQSYGIEKAARRYFRHAAKELTIAESALLAGLLKAPEGLSPYVYPKAARLRQLEVLGKMRENGYITEGQYQAALEEPIQLNTRTPKASKHPYFVTYVIQDLEREFGTEVVRRGGLKVYTTIDSAIQEAAENALKKGIKEAGAWSNVTQGALVSIDVLTGEIIALVGGIDFEKNQFNNATQARRAVGSTFKPFVYLTGFRTGLITPESPISDRPVSFNTGFGIWSPHNWDGRYMGAMNIRKALTLSRNTTTVQVGMKLGIDAVIETARLAGIESKIDPNFSSLLGSSGVSPIELTNAYGTFARGGIRMKTTPIRRLEDSRGNPVDLEKPKPVRVFDPEPVASLVSILVDVVEKGTGKAAILKGRQVAGKTGTTDLVRDIWFVGMTTDMVACVWLGNQKYVPLRGVFSSNAAKVWGEFSQKYYELHPVPPLDFPKPQSMLVKKSVIYNTTGMPEKPKEVDEENRSPEPFVPLPSRSGPLLDRAPLAPAAASGVASPSVSSPSSFKPLVPSATQQESPDQGGTTNSNASTFAPIVPQNRSNRSNP